MLSRKIISIFFILFVVAFLASFIGLPTLPKVEPVPEPPAPAELPQETVTEEDPMMRVAAPLPNEIIASPLRITGAARGHWFFEASFPVRILDADGRELGVMPAIALEEWMTTDFVPFEASISFATSTTETGILVLQKDNPSGLPEHADERRIPVRFLRQ